MSIDIIRILQNFIFTHQNKGFSFNTDNVNETLGQIDYLLADKTGTFTEKKLILKYLVLKENCYENLNGEEDNSKPFENTDHLLKTSPRLSSCHYSSFLSLKTLMTQETNSNFHNCMKCLALCNSLTEHNKEFLGFHEEIALVEAAEFFGYKLEIHQKKFYEIEARGVVTSYKLLCNRPFSKRKKRSRILLEDSSGRGGVLYIKGYPEVLIPLLNIDPGKQEEIIGHIK